MVQLVLYSRVESWRYKYAIKVDGKYPLKACPEANTTLHSQHLTSSFFVTNRQYHLAVVFSDAVGVDALIYRNL